MSERGKTGGGGFDLKRALLYSAAIHLLLLLFSPVLSWQWGDEPERVEETVLKFDLTPAQPEPVPPEPEAAAEAFEEPPPPEPTVPAEESPDPPSPEPMGSPEIGDDTQYATPVPGYEDPLPVESLPAPAQELPARENPPLGEDEPSTLEEIGKGVLPPAEEELGAEIPDPGDAPEEIPGERSQALEPPAAEAESFDVGDAVESFDRSLDDLVAPEVEPPEQEPPEDPGALNLPDDMSLPSRGFQFGTTELRWASGDPRLASYARQMLIYLNRLYKRRQYLDRGRFERWAYGNEWYTATRPIRISFTVLRSGEIVDLRLETSSGLEPLDDVTRNTMLEAVLQPLPPDYPGEREQFQLSTTSGQIGIREFVAWLNYLHRRGLID